MVLVNDQDLNSRSSNNSSNNNNTGATASQYECNICLDTARDAVISMCGHLFCWPCLHKWLETKPNNQTCPVCKSSINREKVIPLYGRNSTDKNDPRDKIPPRPQGQRTEATRNVKWFFYWVVLQENINVFASKLPFCFLNRISSDLALMVFKCHSVSAHFRLVF